MHTNHEPEDPEVLKAMGYDRRDLNVPTIKKWTIITLVFSLFCFAISLPIYFWFINGSPVNASAIKPQPSKIRVVEADKNNPVLQDNITTKVDIMDMRQREDKILSTTEWIDQNKGKVRIPIDQAIKLIAKRGVETGNTVEAKTLGNTIPQNALEPKN